MNSEDAQIKAEELVKLSIEYKQLGCKIRTLKAELKQFAELEGLADNVWSADNGYVELSSKTRYKLVDIPADFTVPSEIAAIDTAQKAFKAKIVLSKEGKKMFKEQYPAITNLMVPCIKKDIKVVI